MSTPSFPFASVSAAQNASAVNQRGDPMLTISPNGVSTPGGALQTITMLDVNDATYKALTSDSFILVTGTGVTVQLPLTPTTGQTLTVVATEAATVDGNGQTIGGDATQAIAANNVLSIVYTGGGWTTTSAYLAASNITTLATNDATYDVLDSDSFILVTGTGVTVMLQEAPKTGQSLTIKTMGSATVNGNGKLMDFNVTQALASGYTYQLFYAGTFWAIISYYPDSLD